MAASVWRTGISGTGRQPHRTERSPIMLWTILIILVIVALVLFILGRTRGRRGL